jgi:methylmalonyl-CoA mutase N-terminal domain/subunit
MVRCIEDGYLQGLIADEAWRLHQEVDSGQRPVVGVNRFTAEEPPPDLATYELDAEGRERQLKRLAQVKAERSAAEVRARLTELKRAAEGDTNLMDPLIACANAYCTVGEAAGALREVWGGFRQPVVF